MAEQPAATSPAFEHLAVRRDGDLLCVTLDDAERANALSPGLIAELTALYGADLRADGVRALLLSGAGKNFSAGADLAHLAAMRDASPEENLRESLTLKDLFESVLWQEALTLALVHGSCVAGGCGLATAHDFVVADEGARFLYSEVRIGFVAALVATYLPLRLRGSDLREMLLNPQLLAAARALEIGLINRVVPGEELRAAGEALAKRPEATDADAATLGRLADLRERWLASGERGVADVSLQRFADGHGHPGAQGYFVAWALQAGEAKREGESGTARPLLYVVDPQQREQVNLGRFVKLAEDAREAKQLERLLHREQRKGRLLGLTSAELGTFDTWVSTSFTGPDGKPRRGYEPFEATAYRLTARLDDDLRLHGRAEVDVLAQVSGARVLAARLFGDLVVDRVEIGGQAATFERDGDSLAVALPAPSTTDQKLTLTVSYEGAFVDKVSGIGFAARDPILWHPHVGEVDRATYDVELRWPKRLDLLAGGTLVDSGEAGGERWE
ncbi:MAG TPA: enoyl-CoA hydratase-related protein, partial [Thermoanaerobaculia bacterium]|nr:enoyl-CoA hydratase-related protein [Thermoanaerobaculia bacterium]